MDVLQVKSLEELPPVMTVADVQKALGISRASAYSLVKSKNFPSARITDRRICILRRKFWNWLEEKSSEQV